MEDGLRELPFQAAGLVIYEYSNNQSQAVIEFKGPFPPFILLWKISLTGKNSLADESSILSFSNSLSSPIKLGL